MTAAVYTEPTALELELARTVAPLILVSAEAGIVEIVSRLLAAHRRRCTMPSAAAEPIQHIAVQLGLINPPK